MKAGTLAGRPATAVADGVARRCRARAAALVDGGASNFELFDGFTMKAPELLGSG